MGICCGKEAIKESDRHAVGNEIERGVAEEQEQLGFRFKIITTSTASPANQVSNTENSSVVELTKRDVEHARASISTRSIFDDPFVDIKLLYTFGEQIGKGRYGITYCCVENVTGKSFACKSILKRKLNKEGKDVVRSEVEILKRLSGKPNVVELKNVYEDRESVHVVTELCEGGLLIDHITQHGHYSEKDAAFLFKQIMNFVCVCHSMGVMHRDLKPKNFMLANKNGRPVVKAVDFGLAVIIEEGMIYKDLVGSVLYVAPEVLQGRYGKEIDIWSAGVILYRLLSGFPPFSAETDDEIFDAILTGNIDFESDPWTSISSSAKDLVKRMLTRNPRRRITAAQVLEHPWIIVDATDVPIRDLNVPRIKQFGELSTLKQIVLKVIDFSVNIDETKVPATELSTLKQIVLKIVMENLLADDMASIKHMFTKMDSKENGTISYEDLRSGLSQLGYSLTEPEVQRLMTSANVNEDGTINYNNFISAMILRKKLDNDEHLYKAFQRLDIDNNGYITLDELETALRKYEAEDKAIVGEMINEFDTNNDGKINFDEFCALVRNGVSSNEDQQRCGSFSFVS